MAVPGGSEPTFFFKIVLSPILTDKTLRLPDKFVREFRNDLSSMVTLVPPGEKRWTVRLVSKESELRLCDGLDEFFQFYSVSFGFLLLFEYRGNSEFRVRIFNLTACEIEYPSIDASQQCTPPKLRPEKVIKKEEASCTDNDMDDDDDDGDTNCAYDADYFVNSASDDDDVVMWERPKSVPKPVEVIELSSDDEDQPCATNKRDDLKIERSNEGDELRYDVKKVNNMDFRSRGSQGASVSSIHKPKNVRFRAVMKPYNINEEPMSLNIPADIGRKFPQGVSGLVKLEVSDGRTWTVQGNFLGGRLRSLGKGWAEFAREMKLKIDDICLFELITNDNEFSMKVSMYRNRPFTR